MKFQVTLHKDDWKWVFTQLDKFTEKKRKKDFRLDCVSIRALPSGAEVEFNSCNGTILGSAVVFSDRGAYDPDGDGTDYAIFLAKTFKDALAANPKKNKEDVTLAIETKGKGKEREDRAYLDGVEVPTEKGCYPDATAIQTSTMKGAQMPFGIDAKKLKAGLKDYFEKVKAHRITLPKFKEYGAICLTGDSQTKAAYMYVRRREPADRYIFRKAYGEHVLGEVYQHLDSDSEKAFYDEKHYLNVGLLYKVSEFMSDTHGLGVERSQTGIHRFYADCEKRARFHISTIIMPLNFGPKDFERVERDDCGAPVVYEAPKLDEPVEPPKPVAKPKPIDDATKERVQEFVIDHILRYALNRRIGSNHFTARTLGLVETLDAVEDEYFRILPDVRTQLGEERFEAVKNRLNQILDDQPDKFLTALLSA